MLDGLIVYPPAAMGHRRRRVGTCMRCSRPQAGSLDVDQATCEPNQRIATEINSANSHATSSRLLTCFKVGSKFDAADKTTRYAWKMNKIKFPGVVTCYFDTISCEFSGVPMKAIAINLDR